MQCIAVVLLLLCGCSGTLRQERAVLDGSFAPELELEISASSDTVCVGESAGFDFRLTNRATYDAWTCVIQGHFLKLGPFNLGVISPHVPCHVSAVLGPGESLSWRRELPLDPTICSSLAQIPGFEARCYGSMHLQSTGTARAAPPGRRWPRRWHVVSLDSSGPTVEVTACER